jgi:outer membrane protein assembly factor BamB
MWTMKPTTYLNLVMAVVCLGLSSASADWRAFRGSNSNSAAPEEQIPVTWSVAPDRQKNLAWRVDLPGRGLSSPIVVGDKVVVTCSDGYQNTRIHVLAFATGTGKKLWHRTSWATGRTFCHPTTANATPTPVSDGEAVYALFSSNDLIGMDLDGNFRWFRGLAYDYPKAGNDVGMASSPVVVGDTVVVQVENQGDSFAAGINKYTGETRWRMERPRSANWSSPVVLGGSGGGAAVILQSRSGLVAVAPDTGRELWRFETGSSSMSSSVVDPVRQLILVPEDGLLALKFDAIDKAPAEHWRANKLRLATVSPVLWAGRVFTIKSPAILACGDVETGEVLWQLRLKGQIWSTPVIAGDHLYAINREGLAQVVKLGAGQGEVVAEYDFGEGIDATPAVSDGAYYVRCDKYLWKIAAP